MRGLASRARLAFERGVWPFVAFVALLVAMAASGLAGMPLVAGGLGLAALVVMLGVMLAKPRPSEGATPGEEPAVPVVDRGAPDDRPDRD